MKRQQDRRWILQLGQDQLTPKACYYGLELEKHGLSTYYFSQDRSGLSAGTIARYGLEAEIVPANLAAHWLRYLTLLRKLRPAHIELYLSLRPWTLVFYVACARLFRIPIMTWCRGEILNWERHHPLRRLANRYALRASRLVLLRELYMEEILKKHRVVDPARARLFPNSVPLPPEPDLDRGPQVLFLNSFKPWRKPHLVVEAARIVVDAVPAARFELVGATSHMATYSPAPDSVELGLRKQIERLNLEASVEILPFTEEPEAYLKRAAVFVLPADIVFLNYSLLEAMAQGVVPIVANVEGAGRIVEDGVSGYIVERDAPEIAEKIVRLLEDDALRRRLAQAARQAVKDRYSSERAAGELCELFRKAVWPARLRRGKEIEE